MSYMYIPTMRSALSSGGHTTTPLTYLLLPLLSICSSHRTSHKSMSHIHNHVIPYTWTGRSHSDIDTSPVGRFLEHKELTDPLLQQLLALLVSKEHRH